LLFVIVTVTVLVVVLRIQSGTAPFCAAEFGPSIAEQQSPLGSTVPVHVVIADVVADVVKIVVSVTTGVVVVDVESAYVVERHGFSTTGSIH